MDDYSVVIKEFIGEILKLSEDGLDQEDIFYEFVENLHDNENIFEGIKLFLLEDNMQSIYSDILNNESSPIFNRLKEEMKSTFDEKLEAYEKDLDRTYAKKMEELNIIQDSFSSLYDIENNNASLYEDLVELASRELLINESFQERAVTNLKNKILIYIKGDDDEDDLYKEVAVKIEKEIVDIILKDKKYLDGLKSKVMLH